MKDVALHGAEVVRMPTRTLWVKLLLYPGHTLPTAAVPILVGMGLAAHEGKLVPWAALLAFLSSWLVHLAGVLFDNHELLRRHPRVPEHPELLLALADHSLILSQLRMAIALCLVGCLLAGACLAWTGGAVVLALGAVGLAASLGYAGGPWPYAARGWADIVFCLMFGVVAVVGTFVVQAAALAPDPGPWLTRRVDLPLAAWMVGLPAGALVTCVLIIDDVRDRDWDHRKGWRTGAVRWGLGWSRTEFTLLVACAYLAPLLIWLVGGFTPWVLLPCLTLPAAVAAVRAVRRHDSTAALLRWTPRVSLLSMVYAALLALGLAR